MAGDDQNQESADLDAYRGHIVKAEQKAVQDYDKTLIALSGGAIAISLVFVSDVVGAEQVVARWSIGLAWAGFTIGLGTTLASFYCSHKALRKTLAQIDDGTIWNELPGGRWGRSVVWLNLASGVSFLFGVLLMLFFVFLNLGNNYVD